MLNDEDKKEIVNTVLEEIMVQMPDFIGGLMMQHSQKNKLKKEFYEKNPEFVGKNEIVADVLQKLEGSDLTLTYEEILAKSIPIIRERINLISTLDVENVKDRKDIDLTTNFDTSNGVL